MVDTKMQFAIQAAATRARASLKKLLPRQSGNLQDNSFKVRDTSDGVELYIDEMIAPYAKYPHVKKKIDAVWPIIVRRFAEDIAMAVHGRIE